MPSAITIFAVPADLAGTFRGGSRLHLATLHSGRVERSAGSPIRSFFRSRKTQRSSRINRDRLSIEKPWVNLRFRIHPVWSSESVAVRLTLSTGLRNRGTACSSCVPRWRRPSPWASTHFSNPTDFGGTLAKAQHPPTCHALLGILSPTRMLSHQVIFQVA